MVLDYRCLLAFVLLAACSESSPAADAGHDAARPVDASNLDATIDSGARDAALPRCLGGDEPPEWARTEGAPHRWRVECEGRALSLWALEGGVLRVRYLPLGEAPVDRSFALSEPAAALAPAEVEASAVDGGNALALCTEHFVVRVEQDCALRVEDRAGRALLEDVDSSASHVVRRTPPDEPFFGLGEKTGPLDRRGRRFVFWNRDAYDPALGGYRPDQDPLYLSIPFFVGLREGAAYGLFTDVAHRVEMDLAASDADRYRIATSGPMLDQYLVAGPSVADVVRRYTGLTGRTPIPPRWALGYHQSRWGYWPDTRLDELADRFREREIPADALWLDIQHMRGYRTFTFDPDGFPDPEALASRLRARGLRLVVIADPGLKVDPGWNVYDRALTGGLALHHSDGRVYEGNAWPGRSIFLDFTLPAARTFWASEIEGLVARGIAGIWLDVNEPTVMPESGGDEDIPNELPIDGDGLPSTMAEGHNVYALHQARATYEGMLARAPDRRPFILTRAGFAGIQRHAAVWTGDAPSTWESLRQTPAMLMSLGLSGVPFVGSDIGGYSGNAPPELFARWMEVGAFSPFCRAHVTIGVPDQEPWAFGSEVEDISRHRLNERYRWLPYLYSLFAEAAESGAPPLRPMVWEFQDEPAIVRVDDQMMFGPWLLVAPVLEPGTTRRIVRLPAGRWYELESDAIYEGPGAIEVSLTLAAVPTFVREGAILPRSDAVPHTGVAPSGPLRLDLYPAGEPTTFTLYEDEGDGFGAASRTRLELARTELGARLVVSPREGTFVPAARALELRVHRVERAVTAVRVDGEPLDRRESEEELSGGGFFVDERASMLVVRIPDRAGITVDFEYDATIGALRPDVGVLFEVRVPPGTPLDRPVHLVSSADGWVVQHPLAWVEPGLARGVIQVPRGEWFFYKYTRGTWDSVEKYADCSEAENRYGFGAAHPMRRDRVDAWRDTCF